MLCERILKRIRELLAQTILGITGVTGTSPLFDILKKTTCRKIDLFPFSGEGVGDIHSLGSVRKVTYLLTYLLMELSPS
jgi:hypothetical protein